ncbi:MAG: type II secretion system F family protein [Patescibacteria group bacterium]|jgi:type IV pilus assembly protein PilC
MPTFAYTARATNGATTSGTLEAKDEKFLAAVLNVRGLALLNAHQAEAKSGKKKFSLNISFGGVPIVQKIFFLQNLQVMVRTGFSLGHALDTLALQTEHKMFRGIIQELSHDVEAGTTLSAAMGKHPKVFTELFTNMIAAGEVSGKLEEVLKRLTIQIKKQHQLVSKIKGALTYPIIVVSAMVVLGVVMMVAVLPKLLTVFDQSGGVLPLPTRILIAISNFLQHNLVYVIIGAIIVVFTFRWAVKKGKGRAYWHSFLLQLPILAPIMKKINLAKFTRNLSSLLKTDIPIVQTFQIISKTLGNDSYRRALEHTAEMLKKGANISKVLAQSPKLFPPIVVQMIAVGEESGTLDTISEEIANFYEEDVDQIMSNLTSILEPILILLLGAGVAGMVVAVILPIYSLSDQIT